MGNRDTPSVRPEVHCAACGAWFEAADRGPRVTCPLCRAEITLGELRRGRRGVPRTGGVEPGPPHPRRARRAARRALAVLGIAALLVAAVVAAVLWLPAAWDAILAPSEAPGIREDPNSPR